MNSIRRRLFIILLAATGLVWLSAVVWLQHSTRVELAQVLDRRLEEAARMVSSLIGDGRMDIAAVSDMAARAPALPGAHDYARQLSCQVWGLDGRLISGSRGAPESRLARDDAEGFSQTQVDGETWRVFTVVEPRLGLRVMVGDALSVRERLVRDVTVGLLIPALLALPLLALLIWWAVGRGLAPLDRMAAELSVRSDADLGHLPDGPAPRELRPMISALNGLFHRLGLARERERDFTAFAAHELKTPLAGLKTQAQIAAIAPDDDTRRRALAQLVQGVDRTDRMVRQLLDMTAIETLAEDGQDPVGASEILSEVVHDLAALARSRGVALRPDLPMDCDWQTRRAPLLAAALRNLVENALNAAPAGTAVTVALTCDDDQVRFCVTDRGPGIAPQDRDRVTQRFYRGTANKGTGSGLGLAIVAAAMERMGGSLTLIPGPEGGEIATLTLPRPS